MCKTLVATLKLLLTLYSLSKSAKAGELNEAATKKVIATRKVNSVDASKDMERGCCN